MERALDAPAGMKALNLLYPLHIGSFGGLPVRVLYALLGLAPLVLFASGCLMWWNRTRASRRRRRRRASPDAAVEQDPDARVHAASSPTIASGLP